MKKLFNEEEAPIIVFNPTAYGKIMSLIMNSEKEIGWHCTVSRYGNEFYIEDAFVYPQYVTGSTINTEQDEYDDWVMSFNGEVLNKMFCHMHSHVNMGVTPSGVDVEHQKKMIKTLGEDEYYLFMIMNKKGDIWKMIVDMKEKLIYENNDIDVIIEPDEEALSLVKEKKYTKVYTQTENACDKAPWKNYKYDDYDDCRSTVYKNGVWDDIDRSWM